MTREQIIKNIEAMEKQGATQQEIQAWLDSIATTQKTQTGTSAVIPYEETKGGFLQNATNALQSVQQGVSQGLTGAAKGIASLPFRATELGKKLAYGIGKVAQKIPITGVQEYGKKVTEYQEKDLAPEWIKKMTTVPEVLKPTTSAQKVGYGGEQLLEFLAPVPTSKATLIPKAGTALQKVLKAVESSAKLAGEFMGKTALQQGTAEEIKGAGVIGAVVPPVFKTMGAAAKKAIPTISDFTAGAMAQMIGKSPEHIKIAFSQPKKVIESMSKKLIPLDIRERAVKALDTFESSFQDEFQKGLESLQKTYNLEASRLKMLEGLTKSEANTALKNSVKSIVNNVTDGIPKIFRDMRVSVLGDGKILDFDRLSSAIVKPAEQKNLQKVYNTIINQKDFSPNGMQAVAARINALSKFTEGAREESSVIISKIHKLYAKAIEETYPELAKLRQKYAAEIGIYKGIDEILKSVKNQQQSPTAVTGVVKKLSNLFAEDNEAYLRALASLEEKTGVDLLAALAGTEFKYVFPGSIGSKLFQAGALAGGFIYNPAILATLPLFFPKVQGTLVTRAGLAAPYVGKAIEAGKYILPRIAAKLQQLREED